MLRKRRSIPSLAGGESYELRGMLSAPGYEGPVSQKVSVKINDVVRYVQIKGRTVMRIGFSPDSVLFERTAPPALIYHVMVTVPERNHPLTEVSVRSPVSFVKTTSEIVNGVGMISICLAAVPPSGELDIPLQVHVTGRNLLASKVLRVGGNLNNGYSTDKEAIVLKSTDGSGTVRVSVNPPLSPDRHLAVFQSGDAWTTAEVHIDPAGGIVLNYSNIADAALFEQGWILVRQKSDERDLIFLPVYLAVQPMNSLSGS